MISKEKFEDSFTAPVHKAIKKQLKEKEKKFLSTLNDPKKEEFYIKNNSKISDKINDILTRTEIIYSKDSSGKYYNEIIFPSDAKVVKTLKNIINKGKISVSDIKPIINTLYISSYKKKFEQDYNDFLRNESYKEQRKMFTEDQLKKIEANDKELSKIEDKIYTNQSLIDETTEEIADAINNKKFDLSEELKERRRSFKERLKELEIRREQIQLQNERDLRKIEEQQKKKEKENLIKAKVLNKKHKKIMAQRNRLAKEIDQTINAVAQQRVAGSKAVYTGRGYEEESSEETKENIYDDSMNQTREEMQRIMDKVAFRMEGGVNPENQELVIRKLKKLSKTLKAGKMEKKTKKSKKSFIEYEDDVPRYKNGKPKKQKKELSAKQQDWINYVKEIRAKPKYSHLSWNECVKIASQKRKKQ